MPYAFSIAQRLLAAFTRGVPELNPVQAGYFRVVLAATLAAMHFLVLTERSIYVSAFRGGEQLQQILDIVSLPAYVLFAAGVLTRLSHLAAVVVFVARFLSANHSVIPLIVGTLITLAVPMGHGFSIDRLLLKSRAPLKYRSAKLYGLAPWGFGLVLSFAYGSAALSKVWHSGWDWLQHGIYAALLEDAFLAPVPVGVWVLNRPWMLTLLGIAGVVGEALWFFVPFLQRRMQWIVGGSLSLCLTFGFTVLQGVIWLPFVAALFLFFFPWERVGSRVAAASNEDSTRAPTWYAGITRFFEPSETWSREAVGLGLAMVCLAQTFAVLRQREYAPFASHYPMYNHALKQDEIPEFLTAYRADGRASLYHVEIQFADGRRREFDLSSTWRPLLGLSRLKYYIAAGFSLRNNPNTADRSRELQELIIRELDVDRPEVERVVVTARASLEFVPEVRQLKYVSDGDRWIVPVTSTRDSN